MILREALNDNYKDKIKNISISLDLQWWLFKSILCIKALDKLYYMEWYKLYNNFSKTVDDICAEDNDFHRNTILDLKNTLNKFDRFKTNVESQLSDKLFDDLNIVLDKLSKGIEDIINILKDDMEAI